MAKKTITVPVTLHAPGKKFRPFKFDAEGGVLEGRYDVVEYPPMTPVELDADEADELLARYAGHEGVGEVKTVGGPDLLPAPAADTDVA